MMHRGPPTWGQHVAWNYPAHLNASLCVAGTGRWDRVSINEKCILTDMTGGSKIHFPTVLGERADSKRRRRTFRS